LELFLKSVEKIQICLKSGNLRRT